MTGMVVPPLSVRGPIAARRYALLALITRCSPFVVGKFIAHDSKLPEIVREGLSGECSC